MEKVSVIVPAYNAENCVQRAIHSLLSQTKSVDEIIVVDDGSNDSTSEVVVEMQGNHEGLILLKTKNRGLSAARNLGVMKSTGDIVFFLDADDWFANNHVETLVGLLIEQDCDIAFSGIVYVGESREVNATFSLPSQGLLEATRYEPTQLREQLYSLCTPAAWSKAYRRNLFEHTGLFDESIKYAEDVEFFLRVFATASGLAFTRQHTIYYDRRTSLGELKMSSNRGLITRELSHSIQSYLNTAAGLPEFAQEPARKLISKVVFYELRKLSKIQAVGQSLRIIKAIGIIRFASLAKRALGR